MSQAPNRALPRGIVFSDDEMPLAVQTRVSDRELSSSNGTTGFGPSSSLIRIPLKVNGFIDTQLSFLKFTFRLTVPDTDAAIGVNCPNKDVVFDGEGCWSLFRRMQVLGSDDSTIEDIENYNLLYTLLVKISAPTVFHQVATQALAGAPGMTTCPIPAISSGGDMATPYNPCGRHSQTKDLTFAVASNDWRSAGQTDDITGPANPIIGPLFEVHPDVGVWDTDEYDLAYNVDETWDPTHACSLEAAGPEQWFGYFAGLGTTGQYHGLNNQYQAFRYSGASANSGVEFDTAFGNGIGNDRETIAASQGVCGVFKNHIGYTQGFKPLRCFNRGAIGVGGVTPYNPQSSVSVVSTSKTIADTPVAGETVVNSRSNPLSMPSWVGANHSRVVAAMGTVVNNLADGTAQRIGNYVWKRTVTGDEQDARKEVMTRTQPFHQWQNSVTTDYDSGAELSYNDWFAFQHTNVRQHNNQMMMSDGMCTPAPLISYVGSDGVGGSSAVVIRYDKAKTKGNQNLAGRLLLGHAPSNILFNDKVENREGSGTIENKNKARPQVIERVFMMPLVSGLLNSPKYLPALLLSGNGAVLQLHCATNKFEPFRIIPDQPTRLEEPASAGFKLMSYEIDNPVYRAHVLTFNDDVQSSFAETAARGGIAWRGQSWRSHTTNMRTNDASVNLTFTERVSSLKGMMAAFRPQPYVDGDHRMLQINTLASYRCGINSYQWMIGSVSYPDQWVDVHPFDYQCEFPSYPFPRTDIHNKDTGMINCVDAGDHYDNAPEKLRQNTCVGYSEVLKLFGKLTNVNSQHNYKIEDYERECRIAGKKGTPLGASEELKNYAFEPDFSPYDCEFQKGVFVVALATETLLQDSGIIQSGVNTASGALSIELRLKRTTSAANATINVTLFTLFDQSYAITPQGTLAVNS